MGRAGNGRSQELFFFCRAYSIIIVQAEPFLIPREGQRGGKLLVYFIGGFISLISAMKSCSAYLQESMPNEAGSKSSLSVPGFGFFLWREKEYLNLEQGGKLNFLETITFIKIMKKQGFGLILPLWV